MAYQNLNRNGTPSTRNKARAFRPPRIVIKDGVEQFHEMDMMRLGRIGPDGRAMPVNSTGCFGYVSKWGMSRISIVVRKGAPGRNRAPRPKKKVSKLYPGKEYNIIFDFQKIAFQQCRNLRGSMLTLKILSELTQQRSIWSEGLEAILSHMTTYLHRQYPEKTKELNASDHAREKSVAGMVRASGVKVEGIRSLDQKIKRMMGVMRVSEEETNHLTK